LRESLVDRASVERLLLVVGALRSGLIDALAAESPAPAPRIAAAAGADLRASRIVLEALTEEGIAERAAGDGGPAEYVLSAKGRAHLVDPGPLLERAGLVHQANKARGWLELPEVIRTGKPAPRNQQPGSLVTMVSAMGERDPAVLDEVVGHCFDYAGKIGAMADIGGAVGHLARQFSRRGVRATLFDQVDTLPVAREFLGPEAEDIAMEGGDYTVALPRGPFDLVYFGNVYHIYGRETNARVTREAFSITAKGGAIAIQDYVWGLSHHAAMFAVNMLRATEDGDVWTEADYRGWLVDSGFVDVEVRAVVSAGTHLMFGRRPQR
jgi:hypothetical protein